MRLLLLLPLAAGICSCSMRSAEVNSLSDLAQDSPAGATRSVSIHFAAFSTNRAKVAPLSRWI